MQLEGVSLHKVCEESLEINVQFLDHLDNERKATYNLLRKPIVIAGVCIWPATRTIVSVNECLPSKVFRYFYLCRGSFASYETPCTVETLTLANHS